MCDIHTDFLFSHVDTLTDIHTDFLFSQSHVDTLEELNCRSKIMAAAPAVPVGKVSRSAAMTALWRAQANAVFSPVPVDPLAATVVAAVLDGDFVAKISRASFADFFARMIGIRSYLVDLALERAISHTSNNGRANASTKVTILGCGYDSRCYRSRFKGAVRTWTLVDGPEIVAARQKIFGRSTPSHGTRVRTVSANLLEWVRRQKSSALPRRRRLLVEGFFDERCALGGGFFRRSAATTKDVLLVEGFFEYHQPAFCRDLVALLRREWQHRASPGQELHCVFTVLDAPNWSRVMDALGVRFRYHYFGSLRSFQEQVLLPEGFEVVGVYSALACARMRGRIRCFSEADKQDAALPLIHVVHARLQRTCR